MDKQTEYIVEYIVVCISEYADSRHISMPQAFSYLLTHKAITFLLECYEVEHTLSFEQVVNDMDTVCMRNGGELRRLNFADIYDRKEKSRDEILQQDAIEQTIKTIVVHLIESERISILEAFKLFFSFSECDKVCNGEMGLYKQEPAQICDFLDTPSCNHP